MGVAWDTVGKKTVNHTCIRNIYTYSGRDAFIFTVLLFLIPTLPSLLSYIDEDNSTLLTSR